MTKKIPFKGRILMIGYGSVGHCTMPMIDRHLDMPLSRVTVVEPDDHSEEIAPYVARGVTYVNKEITKKNYKDVLAKYVGRGDMVLNLSVNVSSQDVMAWCQQNGANYLDTCIEPWPGYYDNPKLPANERSNYHLRYTTREMARKWPKGVAHHGRHHGRQSRPDQPFRQGGDDGDRPGEEQEPAGADDTGRLGAAGHGYWPQDRSTSPSATPRWQTSRRSWTSSSTPGASMASSARGCSPRSWAGAPMRSACRWTPTSIRWGRNAPSI